MKDETAKLRHVPQGLRALMAAFVLLNVGAFFASAAEPVARPNNMDPRAQEMLRRCSDFLAAEPFFSVNAEVWQDAVLSSGQRVQATRTIDLKVRRPNRLYAEVQSTRRSRGIWYDGKSISILNRKHDLYGAVPAPNSMDEMLDVAMTRYGIAIPLEDLSESHPYSTALKNVSSGTDIGPTTVLGVECEHLAFTQGNVDWQVWIQKGPQPVPRKIVITYKDEDGSPQYTALLSKWDFQTRLPDFVFKFEPPPNASKIKITETEAPNEKQNLQELQQLQPVLPKEQ